jgi:hypothetical protein
MDVVIALLRVPYKVHLSSLPITITGFMIESELGWAQTSKSLLGAERHEMKGIPE